MAEDGKTEQPSARKLRKARKDGQFARTPDAASWVAVACAAAMLPQTAARVQQTFVETVGHLQLVAGDPTPERALAVLGTVPGAVLGCVLPIGATAVGGALLATAAQGVHVSSKAMAPKFSKLNPLKGVKRMFGPKALWEAAKSVMKVAVIGLVVFSLGRRMLPDMLRGPQPLSTTLAQASSALTGVLFTAALAGLALAVADYAYQRRSVMKQLKMTTREVKDEAKQTEGDPQVKAAIRGRQLAASRNRMLAEVAKADVVMVNPTHIAVALKYTAGRGAPRVVAKGAGAMALKIREQARQARVPVVEDKPLARALHRICEVGEEIPAELYLAVARILAYVMATGRPTRTARPQRRPASRLPELPSRAGLRVRRRSELRQARSVRT